MPGAVSVLSRYFLLITALTFVVVTVCCFLGALVPQWTVVDSPTTQSVGLFDTCLNHDCSTNNFPAQIVTGATGECSRQGGELADRLEISAAFIIAALIVQFILIIFMALALNQKIMPSKTGWMVITGVSVLVLLGYLMGFMIASITLNHWLFCDTSFCDAQGTTTDCGFGFSWVCGILIIIGSFAALVFLVLSLIIDGAQAHHNCRMIAIMIMLACVVAAILSVATPHWVAWNQARTSIGFFSTCVGTDCNSNNFVDACTRGPGQCCISGGTMSARLNTSAAFVFLACVGSIGMAVIFFLLMFGCLPLALAGIVKIVTLVVTFVIGLFLSIAMILYHHTMNSYFKCGEDFCYGLNGCGYGFSFAIVIIALILLIILWCLHLSEYNQWFFFSSGSGGYHSYSSSSSTATTSGSSYKKTTTTTTRTTTSSSSSSGRSVRKKNGATVNLPKGDWTFDTDSGYYWSDGRGVFWDAESEMYYNPDTEDWYY